MDYATQSPFSDPGRHSDWLDGTPADFAALRDIASGLVFHHWGNGDPTDHGFAPSRFPEIDLRYAEAMLGRLRELNPSLAAERRPTERILGCCRDFTLLYVTLLRHHHIPARSRVGFGNYLVPGWHLDHVVAEVWDGSRWRLVDPQFAAANPLPSTSSTSRATVSWSPPTPGAPCAPAPWTPPPSWSPPTCPSPSSAACPTPATTSRWTWRP
ncbi:hypothetical protein GCM10018954_023870 [Kutzneria kofuensis]